MTLLAALLLAPAPDAPATVADFFPLVPGTRRTYEEKSDRGTLTLVYEVGGRTVVLGDGDAVPVVQKSGFNQVLGTDYYRIVGPTVFIVGKGEERTEKAAITGGAIDLSAPRRKMTVLLELQPPMPVIRYEGKETTWTFADVPAFKAPREEPIKSDETAIKGVAKPGALRTVLGRRVETIEVRNEVQLGVGRLAQSVVETSVYGRGIGLIESTRKVSGGGTRKSIEVRTRLVSIEDAKGG